MVVRKSDNHFSTNDLYRIPALIMQAIGIYMGYKLIGINKPSDMNLFGQEIRSDYFFAFSIMAIGSIVMFFPFVMKIYKAVKK